MYSEFSKLEEIHNQNRNDIILCRDFIAHNTFWGSEKTDNNGQMIEEILNWSTLNLKEFD